MSCRRAHLVGALAILAGLGIASARGETLEDAWRIAAEQDQALAAVASDAEAARLDLEAARAQRLPSLIASGGYTVLDESPRFDFSATGLPIQLPKIFDDDDFAMAGINATVPLYTGGRISGQVDSAKAQLDAREAEKIRAQQDLRLAVAETYVGVLRSRRALEVAVSSVASLEAYERDVQAMFDRETVPLNDLLSAQVALANARQDALRAANAVELASAAYNRRLGRPLDAEVDLDPALPAMAGELPALSIAALTERALAGRSEPAILEAQALALGHAARAEKARVLPQLNLSGGYNYFENEALDRDTFATASVGVQWAMFDGGQARRRAAALRRQQRAAEQRLADVRTLIALDVRQAALNLEEARSRVEVTREAVAQAEENLRIARQQYEAGIVNSTRVLEAETLRISARTNENNAQVDADLAQLRLARAAGEL